MNVEDFSRYDPEDFSRFRAGDVLDIFWDRGNGELERNYVFCGFRSGLPVLVYAGAITDGNPAFFDVKKMCGYIEKIMRADKKPVDSKIISKILQRSMAD